MNHSVIKVVRKYLVSQLVFFDENLSNFLNTYYPYPCKEKTLMDKQLQKYRKTLEMMLKNDDQMLSKLINKYTIIGSSIKIRYQVDGETETFTVVFPTETDPDKNRISILSPIGRQLLLTSLDQTINLETPDCDLTICVEEIKLTYIGGFNNINIISSKK